MGRDRDDAGVTRALRALARHDESALRSAPRVEAALRANVRARAVVRTRRRYAMLAAAAALVTAVSLASWRWREPAPTTGTPTAALAASAEVATDFLPLIYSSAPQSDGQVVRIEVPRAALTAFGLGSEAPEPLDGAILADVLVGDDGLARAVRFVRAAQ